MSISCDDADYQDFRGLVIIFVLITQSIPLMYLYLCAKQRENLNPTFVGSEEAKLKYRRRLMQNSDDLTPILFLFKHYEW